MSSSSADRIDAISEVPANRWDIGQFYDPDPSAPGKMNTRWGGFLDQVDAFDPEFFAIPPREAKKMDPQQRLLLEVAWEALEDAGQAAHQLAGTNCGVFVGATNNHFADLEAARPELIDAFSGTGSATSIIANRVSYSFDLRGPSMVIDTACSSSLVAVHLACQSLWAGESHPIALAGGVNVIASPVGTIFFSRAGAMAPDGRTKVFDAGSNGFARGEGAGVVVLKPLEEALTDRDFIYAVIRGGAVNQDGRSNGLMAPNRWSQEAVLREALRRTGLPGGRVQYVEAHATGTLLGEDALKLVAERARLRRNLHGEGTSAETEDPFRRLLETVEFSPPKIPLLSSALGRILTISDCTANGWPPQMTTPASYEGEAIQLLLDQEYRFFLQLGPNPILSEVTGLRERPECLLLPTIGSEFGRKDHWRTAVQPVPTLPERRRRKLGRVRARVSTFQFHCQLPCSIMGETKAQLDSQLQLWSFSDS